MTDLRGSLFSKKSHLLVLSARMCIQASMWFLSVFVFCHRLPLLHDTRLKVLRRRVTPQSMRGGCEMLTVQLSHCFAVCLTQRCLIFTSDCFCALEAVFVLFLFWVVWILRSSLFRLYSHCQSVLAHQNPEEYCGDVDRFLALLGFPAQATQACKFLVSSPSFLLSSLKPSDSLRQPSRREREFCLCFSCSLSSHDVYAG